MQRVIIVDFSNLRDPRPGAARNSRKLDGKVKTYTIADWGYINSAINHLRVAAPHSVIYLVAERSMQYEFRDERSGGRRLTECSALPCDEFWHMYIMKTRSELARERGDNDLDKGVRADELILHLAGELDGFVLSADFFRERAYEEALKRIDHRVFYPCVSLDNTRWHFAESRQVEALHYRERFHRLGELRSLEDTIANAPALRNEEIREIQDQICSKNGLISKFWDSYFQSHGVVPRSRLTTTSRPTRRSQHPKPSLRPSLTGTPFERLAEFVGVLPPSNNGVAEDEKLPLVLSLNLDRLQSLIGRGAIVVGRIRRVNDTSFLEWFPGDRRVRLSGDTTNVQYSSIEFVGIKGRVRADGNRVRLEVVESSPAQVLTFAEINSMVEQQTSLTPQSSSRRWSLPTLVWRRGVTRVSRPRPTTPPPGYGKTSPRSTIEVVSPTTGTSSASNGIEGAIEIIPPVPPGSIDLPKPPRFNARLVATIAIATSVMVAVAGLVISLFG